MAHKKGQGASRNNRDSQSKSRGLKAYGGQSVKAGSIIVRQLGTQFKAGKNVKRAGDDSLFSLVDGTVTFETRGRVRVDPAE